MAKQVDWIVAGLGNPGSEYKNSRHNIGWMVSAALAERHHKPVMQMNPKYMQSAFRIEGNLILNILPTTYMNRSGQAILSAAGFYRVPADRIITITDEYNFPPGKLHLRKGGGHGGHNGLYSVIEQLGTKDFYRLRCGIGKDFPEGDMIEYVLDDFREDEAEALDLMISRACNAVEAVIRSGPQKAMSLINSASLWKEEDKEEGEENGSGEEEK